MRGKDGLYRRENSLAFRYKDTEGHWREKYTGKIDPAYGRCLPPVCYPPGLFPGYSVDLRQTCSAT
jgi:hypothetical protein